MRDVKAKRGRTDLSAADDSSIATNFICADACFAEAGFAVRVRVELDWDNCFVLVALRLLAALA